MKSTWIVVAHRAGARILQHMGPNQGLRLIEQVEHEAGRRRSGEIDSDRPGMAYARAGKGGGHPMNAEQSPHEHAAEQLARTLATALSRGRNENRFDQVVLVAEPRFLGILRGTLDPVTASLVSGTVGKDLAHVETRDLAPHLRDVLLV
jgi:protein required for attachment to host cells